MVLLCECCTVEEGILPFPPALNLKGIEATMNDFLENVESSSFARVAMRGRTFYCALSLSLIVKPWH